MAFGGFNDNQQPAPMSDINVTPMVDVMLVLLVIFIITAPLFTHAIKLDLPAASAAAAPEKPDTVTLSIDAKGAVFWDNGAAAIDMPELNSRLAAAAQKKPQPEIQLRADKSTRYEVIAQVMAAAQGSGLSRLGFVTDPKDTATGKQDGKR
ncbi:ExbD/TolR family protein [Lacisediminimonas profundi]|uniref:ExbD/TolR family protein n=1 Tax=Lacisediminimonas profundi TaxID=2603856 RepID=UPI00124B9290|nr:biopolymer transporter ExbD [Lacisediminimonas profundi]